MANKYKQNTFIEVRTQFEGIHCWDNCPFEEVKFLRNPHRHIFHVRVRIEVFHNDRDLEFIMVKRGVENYLTTKYYEKVDPFDAPNLGRTSCEMIAEELHAYLNNSYKFEEGTQPRKVEIEVNEDNENGAIVGRVYNYASA